MMNYTAYHSRVSYKNSILLWLVVILVLFTISCAPREGWGLILWAANDSRIATGTVVPLYFKSNITRCWIAGVPGTNGKEEIALWRIKQFSSKRKAIQEAKIYASYVSLFAQAKRQGLVMREEPDNLSKQVYRFLENERCKILKKVKGVEVRTGNQALQGDWYLVLAEDGTRGYIFSNQFTIIDIAQPLANTSTQQQPVPEPDCLQKIWRPAYFSTLAEQGIYDLTMFQTTFGFFYYGSESKIFINLPWFSKTYPAEQFYRDSDGSYRAEPSKLRFMVTADNKLMCIPPQEDMQNIPEKFPFIERTANNDVALIFSVSTIDIQRLITTEKTNRITRLKSFLGNGSMFMNSSYGTLLLYESGKFSWDQYSALVPDILPDDAGTTGTIAMDRFLTQELKGEWQGAFTLYFDKKPEQSRSFAYKMSNGKLILMPLTADDCIYEQVLTISGTNPLEFSIGSR